MLVLGRKVGEKVYIGENITVTVVASAKGRVRLGFEAPAEISIRREEIAQPPQHRLPSATLGGEPVYPVAGEVAGIEVPMW